MSEYEIKTSCQYCRGDGISGEPGHPRECSPCHGTGTKVIGVVDLSDLEDKINDVLDKCNDIKEVVDEL